MKSIIKGLFKRGPAMDADLAQRFSDVYQQNMWEDDESRSGPGSRLDSGSVATSIETLDVVITENRVSSLNDIPCGDFNWIWKVLEKHPKVSYRGFDIVPELIEQNRTKAPDVSFQLLDITKEAPPYADLVFCKDLLNHLIFEDVNRVICNISRSGSSLLLVSNNFGWKNVELKTNIGGSSRHLDITQPPFDMPRPIWKSHYLGLWDLNEVRSHIGK